jgi:hypothetical protein
MRRNELSKYIYISPDGHTHLIKSSRKQRKKKKKTAASLKIALKIKKNTGKIV